jgi:hypothetical protein
MHASSFDWMRSGAIPFFVSVMKIAATSTRIWQKLHAVNATVSHLFFCVLEVSISEVFFVYHY